MKKQFQFGSAILQSGIRGFVCCLLLTAGPILHAQETAAISIGAVSSGGTNYLFRTGGPVGGGTGAFFINGSDIGTILLKACDLDQSGNVALAELDDMAGASFKLWDTNADGNISQSEFSVAMKEFFPTPTAGAVHGMRVVNGVAQTVPPGELPTPDAILTKHIFAAADLNKDGLLSLAELNEFLNKSFAQWDQDGNGSLDAQELNSAFGQLSLPDEVFTAPIH